MDENDTIAAISTPPGTGGIGIVRMSGTGAFEIASRIFRGKRPLHDMKSHTINYGRLIDPSDSETIDEVLLSKMESPNSFTKEDVVEINCHSGIIVLERILKLLLDEGARLAEPGEFTKRAFLNGRIDLSQAEAVIDLVNSKTDLGAKAAVEQLEGRLSSRLKEIRDRLIGLTAHIEASIDYPEHDIGDITANEVYTDIQSIRGKLLELSGQFEKGRILREGINAVIAGRPNVGKSSLLNELSGKNRAIVTSIPGTTRDIIEEYINIKGVPVRIVDTAGIRETSDEIERIGVERAIKAVDAADLAIIMIDAGEGLTDEDMKIIERFREKKHIILLNKTDLEGAVRELHELPEPERDKVIKTSLKENTGIDELENEISRLFFKGEINRNDEVLVTNIRHENLIGQAIESIDDARSAHECGMPLDCMSIDIRNAVECLGRITGENVAEEIIREIFNKFCIGK